MTGSLPAVPLERLEADDPRELGDYRLLGRLGSGGMGVAFLAEGPEGWAVVKTMWPQLRADPAFRARLARELDAMRAAASPRVAEVLAEQLEGPNPWFAMEFVPGITLKRRVDESGPIVGAELQGLASGLAEAIAATSAVGVVHRDLKPANVMLSPTGPRLIDFGVADISEATQLTQTGFVVGSAGWLAPEQITGGEVSAATDVHAWGLCVLYAATGRAPFVGDNTTATIYQVLHTEPEIPASLGVPLAGLVARALAKEATSRPKPERLTAELSASTTAPATGTRVMPPYVPLAAMLDRAPEQVQPAVPTPGRSRLPAIIAGAVALLLLLVGAGVAVGRLTSSSNASAATATTAPPAAKSTKKAVPAPLSADTAHPVSPAPVAAATPTTVAVQPAQAEHVLSNASVLTGVQDSCGAPGPTGPQTIVDGDLGTSWRCPRTTSTVGATVDYYFRSPHAFTGVGAIEGAAGNAFYWCENGRLRTVLWNFNNGSAPVQQDFVNRAYPGKGNYSYQQVQFPSPETTDHITMQVIDIYRVDLTQPCVVTEEFSGNHVGELSNPGEYGDTAKPSEVQFRALN